MKYSDTGLTLHENHYVVLFIGMYLRAHVKFYVNEVSSLSNTANFLMSVGKINIYG